MLKEIIPSSTYNPSQQISPFSITMAFSMTSSVRAIGLRTQFSGARVAVKARASRATPAAVTPQALFSKKSKTAEKPAKKGASPQVRDICGRRWSRLHVGNHISCPFMISDQIRDENYTSMSPAVAYH